MILNFPQSKLLLAFLIFKQSVASIILYIYPLQLGIEILIICLSTMKLAFYISKKYLPISFVIL
jgi:hypothetical protein